LSSDPELLTRLRYIADAGAWVLLESAIADLPADLRWLYESAALTVEQLAALHRSLGVASAADIAAAAESGAVAEVPGLGAAAQVAIAAAVPTLRAAIPRIPLGRATAVAEAVLSRLRSRTEVTWAATGGSLRRGEETVGDIEIIARADAPGGAIDDLVRAPGVLRCLHRSPRRVYLLQDGVQIGVRFPEPATAGAALVHLTGSLSHVAALRAAARERGLRFTPDRLLRVDGTAHPTPAEEDVYSALGLPFVPPEIRTGGDEIAAARRHDLPALLSRSDIRGDLHMHSQWSDGADTIEAMVETCCALGYEYLAITDHSARSAASRSLSIDDITRQREEIERVRERYPRIAILHGCEVDIMPDGRLDFPDAVLGRFDLVLASLHDRAGQSGDRLLERYLTAMNNPFVTIVTHPTNRFVPHRRGYDLDYDRLFRAAVETRTVMEIDGSPVHLDLDGALARRAIAAGVTVSVDSDSHRARLLRRQMELGVITARRGWVERCHVLNARPLAEVRAFVERKRRG
jgi:DNA polymerase (family 10)